MKAPTAALGVISLAVVLAAGLTIVVRFEDGSVGAGPSVLAESQESPLELAVGDVNCDGSVNAIDAELILQYTARLPGALLCPDGGSDDMDGDGYITSIDAAIILQFVAGLLDSLPP